MSVRVGQQRVGRQRGFSDLLGKVERMGSTLGQCINAALHTVLSLSFARELNTQNMTFMVSRS